MKLPSFRCVLGFLGGLAAGGGLAAAENDGRGVTPLGQATVFAGPDGTKIEPTTESVATVVVTPDSATFWQLMAGWKAGVNAAKTLVVFQGRPRPTAGVGEPIAATPSEEERKGLFQKDGQWLRVSAQEVPLDVADVVRSTVFDGVRERKGMKLCGGFHADFLLRWEGRGLVAGGEALICFGCSEVKLFGATGVLHGDLAETEVKRLRELLAPFVAKRDAAGVKNAGRENLPTPPARR